MKMIVVVLNKSEYKTWMDNKKKSSTFKQIYFPVVAPAAPVAEVVADSTVVAAK
jgi:hypothetical protein